VSLLDLFPTLLGVAGLEPPPSDGVDLIPVLQGRVSLEGRALRAEHFRPDFFTRGWQVFHPLADHRPWRARRAAVIVGTRKRIVSEDGSDLAFELAQDPQELHPGAGPATGLEVTLPEPDAGAGAVPTPDAAQRERLKALGYSQ
jgi:arylsulfatase A-like enzyme